uniref:Putative secreted protein n=1 Tax=Anopheles marajoara TaxID=58244 RepID=A0A2M4CAM0_9DIPT
MKPIFFPYWKRCLLLLRYVRPKQGRINRSKPKTNNTKNDSNGWGGGEIDRVSTPVEFKVGILAFNGCSCIENIEIMSKYRCNEIP